VTPTLDWDRATFQPIDGRTQLLEVPLPPELGEDARNSLASTLVGLEVVGGPIENAKLSRSHIRLEIARDADLEAIKRRVQALVDDVLPPTDEASKRLPSEESTVDGKRLERFAEQPVVLLDPGEYTLRIEEVQIAEDRLSIRPLCIVIGGDSDGKKVCPETYDFHEGGENAAAIRNLYGWGVSEQELTSTGGDVESIGALLEGRLGRVSLQQCESKTGEVVNTHRPGAIKPVEQ